MAWLISHFIRGFFSIFQYELWLKNFSYLMKKVNIQRRRRDSSRDAQGGPRSE